MSFGQAAWSLEHGTGAPVCTHPTSGAAPQDASTPGSPRKGLSKVPPSGDVRNFSSPTATGMTHISRYSHFCFLPLCNIFLSKTKIATSELSAVSINPSQKGSAARVQKGLRQQLERFGVTSCFWMPEKSLEGSSPLVRMGES